MTMMLIIITPAFQRGRTLPDQKDDWMMINDHVYDRDNNHNDNHNAENHDEDHNDAHDQTHNDNHDSIDLD